MVLFVFVQPVTGDAATDTFRLRLLQYRARCYLLMHALKACKREIKSLITAGGPVGIEGNRLRTYIYIYICSVATTHSCVLSGVFKWHLPYFL
jgi:hypothetical protein